MKRFIITESEKNNIREMYGMLKEQTTPNKPEIVYKTPRGVTLSDGVTYFLPKIQNEEDLKNFTSVTNNLTELVLDVVGAGRAYEYPTVPKNNETHDEMIKMKGFRLYKSIREFLIVHAITGKTEPLTLKQLEQLIDALSKNTKNNNVFTYSPSFLKLLFNENSGISGDAKKIESYYQNLLKEKLES